MFLSYIQTEQNWLSKTNIFFSRFEETRGENHQIFRTPADTEGKVVLMWMTGAYQYWTNYSTAINYAFVWVRRKTKLLFSKKILSFFVGIVPSFYKTKRIKLVKILKKQSPDFITSIFLQFILKVSWFRNVILLSSNWPKNQWNFVKISALASKKQSNQKSM